MKTVTGINKFTNYEKPCMVTAHFMFPCIILYILIYPYVYWILKCRVYMDGYGDYAGVYG